MAKFEEEQPEPGSGIVEWTPPNMNWNPWINRPMIIEGAEEYQVGIYLSVIVYNYQVQLWCKYYMLVVINITLLTFKYISCCNTVMSLEPTVKRLVGSLQLMWCSS